MFRRLFNRAPDLVKELRQRQFECNMSDKAFCNALGINRTTWFLIRKGRRPGPKFLRAVLLVFPQLKKLVWEYKESKK